MLSKRTAKIISLLPECMVSYFAKKVLNKTLDKYANVIIEGEENLKNLKTPTIFVGNHLSNADGLILNRILQPYNTAFVAGIKLSQNSFTNLGRYVVETITIKPNSADKEAISNIVKTAKSGKNIMLFPEGTRSRTGAMIEAKKGVTLIQRLAKAEIIPIGIWGSEKLLPINSKDMGLEKFHYADVNVKIGKPIEIPIRKKEEDRHIFEETQLNHIMCSIAELLPENYRGVYSESLHKK